MANKHQKNQKQRENKPLEQPTTPAKPVELSEEELGQVVGGHSSGSGSGAGIVAVSSYQ